jgi:hypothetical protein
VSGGKTIQSGWTDERDGQFFRITSSCFSASFCFGASVLLASYDPEDEVGPIQSVDDRQLRPTAEGLVTLQPSP